MVLSSVKLRTSALRKNKNISFMKMLNSIGPRIEPWGTHESNTWGVPLLLCMFTYCFRFFKYE